MPESNQKIIHSVITTATSV